MAATERHLAALLSADVVGYGRLIAQDEAGTVEALEERKRLLSNLVDQHAGRVVDSPGDNLLAEFPSAVAAVQSAVHFQRAVAERNEGVPDDRRMQFRVGVHLGELLVREGRVYGDGINVTARLERLAEPGGICVSRTVRNEVQGKTEIEFEDLGDHPVKNIVEPIHVYRVRGPGIASTEARTFVSPGSRRRWLRSRVGVALLVVAVAGAMGTWTWWRLPTEPSGRRHQTIEAAYDSYNRGRLWRADPSPQRVASAIQDLENATRLDPNFAPAYVELARIYLYLGEHHLRAPDDAMPKARTAALAARAIDDRLPKAHAALGFVHVLYDWDWEAADNALIHALELDPNDEYSLGVYAFYLSVVGRHEEAIAQSERAVELAPFETMVRTGLALRYLLAGRYEQAEAEAARIREQTPDSPAGYGWSAWIPPFLRGDDDTACKTLVGWLDKSGADAAVAQSAQARCLEGGTEALFEAWLGYPNTDAWGRVVLHSALGHRDETFEWLERAYQERNPRLPLISGFPLLIRFRDDPRFAELAERVGIPIVEPDGPLVAPLPD